MVIGVITSTQLHMQYELPNQQAPTILQLSCSLEGNFAKHLTKEIKTPKRKWTSSYTPTKNLTASCQSEPKHKVSSKLHKRACNESRGEPRVKRGFREGPNEVLEI